MSPDALQVSGLEKHFAAKQAVRSVSFGVRRGEIYGLLGPNGAGKTTTIRMIAGVLVPSAGTVACAGRLGLVPQSIALYPALSAEENLRFFGKVHGLRGRSLDARVDELLEHAGLSSRRNDRVAFFSGGMKRRLNLACGLVHGPEVVLLDEPTVGVDPQSRQRIYDQVQSLAASGLALLLTTHYLEEAERLCGRLSILDEGKIVAEGTVRELVQRSGREDVIELCLEREPGSTVASTLSALGADRPAPDRLAYRIRTSKADYVLTTLLALVAAEGNTVSDLRLHHPNLGDAFIELTGKELRD